jgi:hypothetical protein
MAMPAELAGEPVELTAMLEVRAGKTRRPALPYVDCETLHKPSHLIRSLRGIARQLRSWPPSSVPAPQLRPSALCRRFWEHHTLHVYRRIDLLQLAPAAVLDALLLARHGCCWSLCLFAVLYLSKAAQLAQLLHAQPGRYTPIARTAFVLFERSLRTCVYYVYLGPQLLLSLAHGAPAGAGGRAFKLLWLGSGAAAALWHSTFMPLPWLLELPLLGTLTLSSLRCSRLALAQLLASWPPGSPLHRLRLRLSSACRVACSVSTFVSIGWAPPMCRSTGVDPHEHLAASFQVFACCVLPAFLR